MRQVLITESSLRELLKEMMDSESPVNVNPVVDPSAAETDPSNINFLPSNKAELMSALRVLVNSIDDQIAADIYVTVQDAMKEKEDEMKNSNVEYLCEKYSIPNTYQPDMWKLNTQALNGSPGIWTHVSFRADLS